MDKKFQPGAGDDMLTPLILGHLDGRLGDAEFAALEQRLADDPAARDLYVRLARLDAWQRVGHENVRAQADDVFHPGTTGFGHGGGDWAVRWIGGPVVRE